MKQFTILVCLIWIISLHPLRLAAQSKFCPPGATWSYNFIHLPQWFGNTFTNEKIWYMKDSVIGTDTVKLLAHFIFYRQCNDFMSPLFTLIKQRGDTIYFRNRQTQNTWQILFNFNTAPGFGWQTTILKNPDNATLTVTYGFTVDSVSYVTINNHVLKRLHIGAEHITERIGWNSMLFRYDNHGCDGYYLSDFLCYSDLSFGTVQFSHRSCDFSGVDLTGIDENGKKQFRLYPNPAENILHIEFPEPATREIRMMTIAGQEILKIETENTAASQRLDLSGISPGLYFIEVRSGGKSPGLEKLVLY